MVLSAGVFAGLGRGFHVYLLDDGKRPLSTRGVLVTGEDTCDHEASTIERTLRRVSSAMLVSFGVSLRGAVGPIEDGTDVFAGQFEFALHMHDGPDGRHDLYMWSTQPAKTCVT